jgi:hypothetical protein
MGEIRGRTKEENTKFSPRSRSIGFPHKEERLIGRIVDLDLLSLFPQEYARIMGGMGEIAISRRSTMEGKHEFKGLGVVGEEAPLNRCHTIQPLQPEFAQDQYWRSSNW